MPRPQGPLVFYAIIMTVAGSAALLSTLILGWYSTSLGGGSNVANETLFPTTVHLWGSQGGSPYSAIASYSAIELGNTGALYLAVTGLVAAGGLLGVTTAYLMWRGVDRTPRLLAQAGLMWRGANRTPRRVVSALLVITILLALAGPVAVAFAQPGIVCSDSVVVPTPFVLAQAYSNHTSGARPPCGWDMPTPIGQTPAYTFRLGTSPGPQTSFFGTDNETGQVLSWGPSVGWYLAMAASALLVIGAAEFGRATRRPELLQEKHQTNPDASDPPRVG
jgi:hypothetical protein